MSVPALAIAPWESTARDARWLSDEMDDIWRRYFADTPRVNIVEVSFRRPWMRRLGVISLSEDEQTTRIGVNSLLAHRPPGKARPAPPHCRPSPGARLGVPGGRGGRGGAAPAPRRRRAAPDHQR